MSFKEIISQLNAGYVAAGIAVLLSLIQISPLKLNPWDKFLGWIGKKVNGANSWGPVGSSNPYAAGWEVTDASL